jgi:hypothetical protein
MHATRLEIYQRFLGFVRGHSQRERQAINRRMLSVFLWCFLVPAVVALVLLLLVRLGALPLRVRYSLEWILLLFPVSYALFFLSSEVLRDLPSAFRQGALGSALRHADHEGRWRQSVAASLREEFGDARPDWDWLERSFRADIESMQHRNRYLTALAGAVFYLIMQGIDLLGDADLLGETERASADFGQFVGLALFLVLLYLSGSQTLQAMRRYLSCLELARHDERAE